MKCCVPSVFLTNVVAGLKEIKVELLPCDDVARFAPVSSLPFSLEQKIDQERVTHRCCCNVQ